MPGDGVLSLGLSALPTLAGLSLAAALFNDADKVAHDFTASAVEGGSSQEAPVVAEFKRLDEVWDDYEREYVLREDAPPPKPNVDIYGGYCFVIIRHFDRKTGQLEWTKLELKSRWLRKTCGAVIGDTDDIPWNSNRPIRVRPDIFIRFYPLLTWHLAKLDESKVEEAKVSQLRVLLGFIRTEYASKFEELKRLIADKEITFELLGCLLLPGTLLFHRCSLTGEPRAARLVKHVLYPPGGFLPAHWDVTAVYVESTATKPSDSESRFGFSHQSFNIWNFEGVSKIHKLSVHPLHWNPRADELCAELIERGKKWQQLDGVHHVRYDGVAYRGNRKFMTKSRIMIDNVLYDEMSDGSVPSVIKPSRNSRNGGKGSDSDTEDESEQNTQKFPLLTTLSDDELVLTTPILYGFSLSDKRWLKFNVAHVTDINWNDEAFSRLVLPRAQKDLIKGLVEAQVTRRSDFDDFIEGKGRGLVINLFGPPGVGKTMSAEAVSEHLRRPLYMVGAGELGTTPSTLDADLSRIFQIGSQWGSVTLLDEADVFLEQRSSHDLERNALVAVFLRQLEYFPGLLFITTNRVRAFDHAFQSRIHVSLRYRDLTQDARRQVWRAFLEKLTNFDGPLSPEEEDRIVKHQYNGRQIKNAVRTANAVALSRGEKVSYAILCDVVEVMDQFEADLSELNEAGTE